MFIGVWGQERGTKQEAELTLQRKEFPCGENIPSVMTGSLKGPLCTEPSLFWHDFPCLSEGVVTA